jgi:adenine specific DNA methylase Mod
MDRPKVVECIGLDPDENFLIEGEALDALRALERHPRYAERLVGRIKLAYLDPPFNTGQNFKHYRDNVDHFTWNTALKDTLASVRQFLTDDGSVWLHLNDAEQHRARVLLDEVFGSDNFLATIIWERTRMPRLGAKPFAIRHDYIHVYRTSPAFRLPGRAGSAVETMWNSDDVGFTERASTESKELFGEAFATPKPEQLLRRVIELATEPGDLVLDCFAGSGTTPAVAHKLGRRWVAVEAQTDTVRDFLSPRMRKVVEGRDQGGISEGVNWKGGGGFIRLSVERSAATKSD